mgnify:CR=1 FL=1
MKEKSTVTPKKKMSLQKVTPTFNIRKSSVQPRSKKMQLHTVDHEYMEPTQSTFHATMNPF